ncbi:MAG TPA: FecR family protein, partial [Dongiaceae bacterium]|nr:FecR family protein [Dongiaceae bacterium]
MFRSKLSSPHLVISSPLLLTAADTPAPAVTRRRFGHLVVGATVAAAGGISLPLSPALADELTQLGTVSRMKKISGATHGADSRSLTIGDKVYRDDLLWTRSGGQLRIDLKDGSNLSLGENAEVTLEESMLGGGGSAFLRIISGAFRFASGGGEKAATPPKIETPFAVLSLRGTEVYGLKFGKAWGFFVSEGQVEVSNDSGSIVLNKGDGTEVYSRTGKFEPVKQWG